MELIDAEPRVKMFLTVLGLNKKMMHIYTRHNGDFWCTILRRTFDGDLKAIKERLDEAPDYITPNVAKGLVVGLKANFGDHDTWDTTYLSELATKEQIKALLDKIDSIPKMEGGGADVKGKMDLDHVWAMIFDQYMEWSSTVKQRIIDSYIAHDEDGQGLELPEFTDMVHNFFQQKNKDAEPLSDKEISHLWKHLVDKTGDDDGTFEDASIFSMAAMQLGLWPPLSDD